MVATAEEMVLELSVVLNAVFASSVLPSRVNEMEASIVVAKGVVGELVKMVLASGFTGGPVQLAVSAYCENW